MAQDVTVSQAAGRWLAVYVPIARSAKNVSMAAQRMRDYVAPLLGERLIHELRPDDVREHRLWLQERGLAPRSVRHILTDLRCLLNWAVDSELIPRSPFPRRVMPRIQEEAPDRLTDEQVERILAVGEPHAFVVRLGLGTGLRWGELCRAQASDLRGSMLLVSHTKSARLRRVPVTADLAHEVRHRIGRLVPYSEGTSSSFNRLIQRRSGLRKFHVHQLRHTFACRWIESGGSLPALQQILGHASIVTTQHYARLSDEAVLREAERITGATSTR